MPIEKSAGAVIFRKEEDKVYYLLLHYQAGHWDFSKGNIEKGEKIEETIEREIQEETGITDIEFISGFRQTIKYFYKLKGKTIFKTVVFYLIQTKTKEVKISWEHTDFKWLTYEKALGQITFQNAKEILKKANDFLSEKGL
ncbi:hypothetical protein ES703_06172 [subsurface metagenome]